jgi:hypothetical protein
MWGISARDLLFFLLGAVSTYFIQRRLAVIKNRDDVKSELRKELKALIRDLEDKGCAYWLAAPTQAAITPQSREIVRKFNSAMASVDALAAEYAKSGRELQVKFYTFKRAVTGDTFETAIRTVDHDRCISLSAAANDLCAHIDAMGLRRLK